MHTLLSVNIISHESMIPETIRNLFNLAFLYRLECAVHFYMVFFFKFLWLFFVVLRLGEFSIFLKVSLVCHWYRPLVSIYLVVFRSLPELKEV